MIMGDEAVAHASIDAGVKGIFGYPGTPSTEVFESAQRIAAERGDGRIACWGANEKVGYEMALGASYAGNRSIVTMKHVGLNVAMDPFVNSAITGIHAGLVCLVADDPGMHSSQNEQDSRYLAEFALIPCLEPSTPQEAYDYTLQAYDLSEELGIPVLVRLVTRLAHARGPIDKVESAPPVELGQPERGAEKRWVLIPLNARVQYDRLREKVPAMQERLDGFNRIAANGKKGVVLSGMGRAYFDQLIRAEPKLKSFSRLDVSAYPLKPGRLEELLDLCDEIYAFEESYPLLEDRLLAASGKTKIHGRRDGTVPQSGELNLLKLAKALRLEQPKGKERASIPLPDRPPRLCKGCGHAEAFKAIRTAFENIGVGDPRIFGDIGCYTLGALPPYRSIHTTVEMGASLGMALGAGLVGMKHVVGLIGDSTFFHSGLTPLISLKECTGNVTFVVLDNRITAMTGQQKTVAVGIVEELAKAAGLRDDQIHTLDPLPKRLSDNVAVLERVFAHAGPDLVVFRRDCIEAKRKKLYGKLYGQ